MEDAVEKGAAKGKKSNDDVRIDEKKRGKKREKLPFRLSSGICKWSGTEPSSSANRREERS